MRILLKNGLILSMTNNIVERKDILIEDKKIKKIDDKIIDKNAEIIDCSGLLLMPGFKNTHAHAPMVFARSSDDGLELNQWLNNSIFPMEAKLTYDSVYKLIKLAVLEYLSSGITATCEMYVYPEAMAKAFKEMGFKSLICGVTGSGEESITEMKSYLENINNIDKDLISYRVGTHAEYTLDDIKKEKLPKVIDDYKSIFITHISETKNEVIECKNRRNDRTPVEFFDDLGCFKYGGIVAHCNYLTENDIKILRNRRVFVSTCHGSNTKLNSGICDIKHLLDSGITVTIGTDGAGSNNSLDMFKEMTLIYAIQNLKNNSAKAIDPFEILKMATVNGAKALELNDSDVLMEGKFADIIAINLKAPNMQPVLNIPANLVYSGNKSNIKFTMINGKILYIDGRFPGQNVEQILKDAQEISNYLNQK